MADDDYYVTRGRSLIEAALNPGASTGSSPLEAFTGKHYRQKSTGTEKKLGDPVQEAGLSPTRIHATEARPPGFSRILYDKSEYSGPVLRLIAELPPIQQLWVNHRYRPFGQSKKLATEQLYVKFWRKYRRTHLHNSTAKTRNIVQYLVHLQLINSAKPALLPLDKPREIDTAIREGRMTRANWHKTYAPHWRQILDDLITVDRQACWNIGHKLTGVDKS